MIIWKSKPIKSELPSISEIRNVIDAGWLYLSHEQRFNNTNNPDPNIENWKIGDVYISYWLNRHWDFGRFHSWYDGQHCALSIGFLHQL